MGNGDWGLGRAICPARPMTSEVHTLHHDSEPAHVDLGGHHQFLEGQTRVPYQVFGKRLGRQTQPVVIRIHSLPGAWCLSPGISF